MPPPSLRPSNHHNNAYAMFTPRRPRHATTAAGVQRRHRGLGNTRPCVCVGWGGGCPVQTTGRHGLGRVSGGMCGVGVGTPPVKGKGSHGGKVGRINTGNRGKEVMGWGEVQTKHAAQMSTTNQPPPPTCPVLSFCLLPTMPKPVLSMSQSQTNHNNKNEPKYIENKGKNHGRREGQTYSGTTNGMAGNVGGGGGRGRLGKCGWVCSAQ